MRGKGRFMYDLLEILVWTIGGVFFFSLFILCGAFMSSGHFILGLGTFALIIFMLLCVVHAAL